MQEWLLWTGVVTFGLLAVMSLFRWYFLLVLTTLVIGLGTYVWIRFVYFPPIIAAYNQHLRRTRFFSQEKYKHPETTIRQRSSQRPRSSRGSRQEEAPLRQGGTARRRHVGDAQRSGLRGPSWTSADSDQDIDDRTGHRARAV